MHRTDRLTGILLVLQAGATTSAVLADRFGVSRRTILRDLDSLAGIGVPVVATPGRSGGVRIRDGYWMPPLHLNAEEATALLLALDHLGPPDSSPLGSAHVSAREKLLATIRPATMVDVRRNLGHLRVTPDHLLPDPDLVARFRRAVAGQRWCHVVYETTNGPSERTILPKLVSASGGRWYVSALDALRHARRVFRIDRVLSLRPTIAPADVSWITDGTTNAVPYDAPSNPLVSVLLTSAGIRFARDNADLRTHLSETRDGNGTIRFRCPPSELPYYGRELLALGVEATVLGPPELVDLMRDHLGRLTRHLRQTS